MASKIVAFSPSPLLSNKLSRPSGKSIGPCSVIFPTSGLKPTLAVRAQSNGDYADGTSLDVRVNNTAAVDRRQQPRRWALDASRSGKCSVDEQKWTEEGLIMESMPDGKFQVKLDNGATILGYLSGKLRQRFIRVMPGDRVKLEVSRYDLSKARITYRLRNKDRLPDKELGE